MNRRFLCRSEQHELSLRRTADGGAEVRIDGRALPISGLEHDAGRLSFVLEGRRISADLLAVPGGFELWLDGQRFVFKAVEPGETSSTSSAGPGDLTSKMPGKVLALLAEPGEQVHKGQPLLILEAMKMEHEVLAPANGRVIAFRKAAGDRVMPGDLLVDFE